MMYEDVRPVHLPPIVHRASRAGFYTPIKERKCTYIHPRHFEGIYHIWSVEKSGWWMIISKWCPMVISFGPVTYLTAVSGKLVFKWPSRILTSQHSWRWRDGFSCFYVHPNILLIRNGGKKSQDCRSFYFSRDKLSDSATRMVILGGADIPAGCLFKESRASVFELFHELCNNTHASFNWIS